MLQQKTCQVTRKMVDFGSGVGDEERQEAKDGLCVGTAATSIFFDLFE